MCGLQNDLLRKNGATDSILVPEKYPLVLAISQDCLVFLATSLEQGIVQTTSPIFAVSDPTEKQKATST